MAVGAAEDTDKGDCAVDSPKAGFFLLALAGPVGVSSESILSTPASLPASSAMANHDNSPKIKLSPLYAGCLKKLLMSAFKI
jgi:zona occludens toxin (predicted ATPase)